jgi:hypothetical protein
MKHRIALLTLVLAALAAACRFASGNPEMPVASVGDASTSHVLGAPVWSGGGDLASNSTENAQYINVQRDGGQTGALTWDGAAWSLQTSSGGSVSPGDAGTFLVTNDAGTATEFVYPSGDIAGSSSNPGQLTVEGISGSSPLPISPAQLAWGMSVSSPTLTQTTPSSNLTPQNLEIHAQYPWASATSGGRLPGSVTMSLSDPFNQLAGGFLIQYGTTPLIRFGEYSGNTTDSGVIWFKDGGSPSTTNYGIRGTSSILQLNGPASGTLALQVGGTTEATVTSSGFAIPGLGGSGAGFATVSNAGLLGFSSTVGPSGVTPGTAGTFLVTNGSSATAWSTLDTFDTTHGRFTAGGGGSDHYSMIGPLVGSETSYSALYLLPNGTAATGTNRVLDSDGTSVLRLNSPGALEFHLVNGSIYGTMQASGSQAFLSLGNVVATLGNSNLISDGSFTNVNVATSGAIGMTINNTTYIDYFTTTATYIGGTNGAAPLQFNWSTASTPYVQCGTSATTCGFGSDKAAATTLLYSDANELTLTLDWANSLISTASGVSQKITAGFEDMSQMTAPGNPASGTQRWYVDSTDGSLRVRDSSGNITILAPP